MGRAGTRPLAVLCVFLSLSCSAGGSKDSSNGNPTGPSGDTPTVASIVVGGPATLEFGSSQALTAQALTATQTVVAGQTFVWSSDNVQVATVTQAGLLTPVGVGTATISATSSGKTGSLVVNITSPISALSILGTLAIQAGATTQLVANGTGASGSATTSDVTWSSSDPTLLSVSSTGLVTAARIGSVSITASMLGRKASVVVVSSLTPFTFATGNASAADAQLVRDAVQEAQKFYLATFNRAIQSPTTIVATPTDQTCLQRAGNTAYTIPLTVTICTNAQGWNLMGPIMKQKIVIHETFHLLQNETKWIGPNVSPTWLIEGAAELIGFSGVADMNLLPLATGRQCNVKEWFDFNSRNIGTLPPLSALETQQQWQTVQGPSYDPAFLGADYLTTNAPGGVGLAAFKTFWTGVGAGTPWATVFATAFGQTNTAFYAAFPGYATTALQTPPAQYPCGGI